MSKYLKDIIKKIARVNNKKAAGVDSLSAELFKNVNEELAGYMY